jgi:hypothetical protein
MEYLCDAEWLTRRDASQCKKVSAESTTCEMVIPKHCSYGHTVVVAEQYASGTDESLFGQCPSWQAVFAALENGRKGQIISVCL